jgi:hypothetical protein
LLTVAGLVAVLSFNVAAAALAWPGLVIVNAICSRFGIYLNDAPLWQWLVPGLLIDVAFYTTVFFLCARLWGILAARFGSERRVPAARLSPTTDDRRPTAQL